MTKTACKRKGLKRIPLGLQDKDHIMNSEPPSTAQLTIGAPLISVPGVVQVPPRVGVAHVLQPEDLTSSPAVVKDNPPPRGRRVHSLRAAARSEPPRARKAYRSKSVKLRFVQTMEWPNSNHRGTANSLGHKLCTKAQQHCTRVAKWHFASRCAAAARHVFAWD